MHDKENFLLPVWNEDTQDWEEGAITYRYCKFNKNGVLLDVKVSKEQISGYLKIEDEDLNKLMSGYVYKDGKIELPVEKQIAEYMAQIQGLLDTQAKADGYDNCFNAISYKGSEVARFNNDAERYQRWRDKTWETANNLLIQYKLGKIPQPTIAEVMVLLPKLEERPDIYKYDYEKGVTS